MSDRLDADTSDRFGRHVSAILSRVDLSGEEKERVEGEIRETLAERAGRLEARGCGPDEAADGAAAWFLTSDAIVRAHSPAARRLYFANRAFAWTIVGGALIGLSRLVGSDIGALVFVATAILAMPAEALSKTRISFHGGLFIRKFFSRHRIPFDEIQRLSLKPKERGHLWGPRKAQVHAGGKTAEFPSNVAGMTQLCAVLDGLAPGRVDAEIQQALEKRWRPGRPMTLAGRGVLLAGLALAAGLVVLDWDVLWRGEGITWTALAGFLVCQIFLTNGARRLPRLARHAFFHMYAIVGITFLFGIAGLIVAGVEFLRLFLVCLVVCVAAAMATIVFRWRTESLAASAMIGWVGTMCLALMWFGHWPFGRPAMYDWRGGAMPREIAWDAGGGPPAILWQDWGWRSESGNRPLTYFVAPSGAEGEGATLEVEEATCFFITPPADMAAALVVTPLMEAEEEAGAQLFLLSRAGEWHEEPLLGSGAYPSIYQLYSMFDYWSPDGRLLVVPRRTESSSDREQRIRHVVIDRAGEPVADFGELGDLVGEWVDDRRWRTLQTGKEDRLSSGPIQVKQVLFDVGGGEPVVEFEREYPAQGSMMLAGLRTMAVTPSTDDMVDLAGPSPIALIDLETGATTPLSLGDSIWKSDWHEETSTFVYVGVDEAGGARRLVAARPGEGIVAEARFEGLNDLGGIRISPDRRRVLFLRRSESRRFILSAATQMEVWDIESGEIRQAAPISMVDGYFSWIGWFGATQRHSLPQWSPDGGGVAYAEMRVIRDGWRRTVGYSVMWAEVE